MTKPMTHKGYSARIEYSDEYGCFIDRIAGIRDIVAFHGESVQEIKHAFAEAVDFLSRKLCRQRGSAQQALYRSLCRPGVA